MFFKNHAENETKRLVPDIFLFFKKTLYEVKKKWSAAYFQYISIAPNSTCNKNKLYKTLDD